MTELELNVTGIRAFAYLLRKVRHFSVRPSADLQNLTEFKYRRKIDRLTVTLAI